MPSRRGFKYIACILLRPRIWKLWLLPASLPRSIVHFPTATALPRTIAHFPTATSLPQTLAQVVGVGVLVVLLGSLVLGPPVLFGCMLSYDRKRHGSSPARAGTSERENTPLLENTQQLRVTTPANNLPPPHHPHAALFGPTHTWRQRPHLPSMLAGIFLMCVAPFARGAITTLACAVSVLAGSYGPTREWVRCYVCWGFRATGGTTPACAGG